MSQLYFCSCNICGKTFLSKKKSAFVCISNSTCRVKLSRMNKKAKLESEKLMLDMQTYTTYQEVLRIAPTMETSFVSMLHQFGKDAFKLMLDGVVLGVLKSWS